MKSSSATFEKRNMKRAMHVYKAFKQRFAAGVTFCLLYAVVFYQRWISIFLPRGCCIYQPTCSNYAYQAIQKHGFARGTWLAFLRVVSCHPCQSGGHDPVP